MGQEPPIINHTCCSSLHFLQRKTLIESDCVTKRCAYEL